MSVLFAERIKYDEEINLKLAKEKILNYFRRLTYIAIMLCSDDVLEEVFDEITVQDFPIRGFKVLLHVTRRRWLNENTGKVVFRDWDLVANGTRITKDFAAFLKEFRRYTGS